MDKCSVERCHFIKKTNNTRCKYHAYVCLKSDCDAYVAFPDSFCLQHLSKCIMEQCPSYSNKLNRLCDFHFNKQNKSTL